MWCPRQDDWETKCFKLQRFSKSWFEICSKINFEIIPFECTIPTLKDIILNSKKYKKDQIFVQEILSTVVIERQEREKIKLIVEEAKHWHDQENN